MFFAIGAASSAIDLLSSLGSSSSSSSTTGKTGFVPANTFSLTDPTTGSTPTGGAGGQLSPSTWNTLLAAQQQGQTGTTSRSAALDDLFSQIDGNGDGQIDKTEFENALGAGGTNLQMADDVFNKMDLNGDGTISKDEMSQSLEKSGGHHHHHAGGTGGGNADALMQALQGATSTSSTNDDGSTTTTLTYADGTKITMTQPAASSSSTTSTGHNAIQSYNLTERLIERQAQWLAANAQQSLSMSA
jgi:EF hand domain-containing protein